jgi:hypothetical protein
MASADPVAVLDAHVRRLNDAVRLGDFTAMVAGFTPDGEMAFEGVPIGPFIGPDAIAEAYSRQPPTDEVRLLGVPHVDGESVESDYGWGAAGERAGRMIVTTRAGLIARLVVTFE